jgi:hypothetical protein
MSVKDRVQRRDDGDSGSTFTVEDRDGQVSSEKRYALIEFETSLRELLRSTEKEGNRAENKIIYHPHMIVISKMSGGIDRRIQFPLAEIENMYLFYFPGYQS